MKQLPVSSGNEDDDEGHMGKRSKSRTKNEQHTQELIPISYAKSKGKSPRYNFIVKGSKGGESFVAQDIQQLASNEPIEDDLEIEQEEGEIPQEEEMQDVEESIPLNPSSTPQVTAHDF